MLSHLVIRNFAIIHHLEIPFYDGLTVLTGETGAGKSIVINALNLVLGGRASTDVIRTDQDEAVVEAVFQLSEAHVERVSEYLDALGIDPGAGQLVVRRIISRSGRNKVFINGSASTLSVLQDITSGMVDISGQHEHYSLMKREKHIRMLDAFGVLNELSDTMQQKFERVQSIRAELESLQTDERDRLNRIDFLTYQLEEIESAGLSEGEEEELESDFNRLKNAEKIHESTSQAGYLIYNGDKSAVEKVSEAHSVLAKMASVDEGLAELADRLDSTRISLEDIARELDLYTSDLDSDPRRLDKVISRLEMIKKLKRRHGVDIAAVLEEARQMREELDNLENAEERSAEIEAELKKATDEAMKVAQELSKERREAGNLLKRGVESELEGLNMKGAQLEVWFEESELSATGIDTIEFLLAANAGEAPKPMTKIASGGELSRIMLAMKAVLADRDSIPIYIFDEVDTGIGGSTADRVGEKIAETATQHQVLCITHLAQIASRGNHHYLVEKATVEDRTESSVRPLTDDERVEEIARMLGGARVTAKTREAASELLAH